MRLEKASRRAIVYSCKEFHYAKSVPVNPFAFSVFNDQNEWCGCIVYSLGANPRLGLMYHLCNGQFVELTRMALNGKQETTGKALSISLKLLRKFCPLVKLVISFADTNQKHVGIIYQATNFIYTGTSKSTPQWYVNNRWIHQRMVASLGYAIKGAKFPKRPQLDKLRYIFPLDKSLIPLCESMRLPYPKSINAEIA